MDSNALFKVLDRLVKSRPFERDGVATAVGLGLVKSPSSDDFFDIFRSPSGPVDPASPVTSAELRKPGKRATVLDGLVLLGVRDNPCILRTEVAARYGKEKSVLVPTPHQPPD